jgi:hypothetical protein
VALCRVVTQSARTWQLLALQETHAWLTENDPREIVMYCSFVPKFTAYQRHRPQKRDYSCTICACRWTYVRRPDSSIIGRTSRLSNQVILRAFARHILLRR